MKSNYKTVKLGDVVDIISKTYQFKDSKSVVFINTGDILEGKFLHSKRSNPSSLPGQAKKSIKKGDILFSEIRPANKRYALVDFDANDYVVSTKLMVLRPKNNIDPQYLYIWLTMPSTLRKFQTIAESRSGTFPQITFEAIKNEEIPYPPLSEQKRISSILSSFDNKIEQLKKQNNILEDIAQSIFKEWFVKYNFPNKDGKPYKDNNGKMIDSELGLIPEGWRVTTLKELVDTVNGYSYKGSELRKSDSALVTLKNFNRNGGFKEDGLKEFIGNPSVEHEVQEGDLVVAHTDLTQDGEVLGNPILIPATKYTKLYITMDCVKVTPKKDFISKEFLYYLMLRPEFKGHCLGYANGTTVLHLSKKAIPEYKIPIPRDNYYVLNLFNELAKHQQQDTSKNIQMINSLTLLKIGILNKLIQ